ncbi:MAG: hypothetical protein K2M76_04830, partial [Muribaculaceae bacterium]|nr:hypothetical protein [Muribaculaceae bacterium]
SVRCVLESGRKLEDDWRRRNKASFSFDEIDNNSPTEASDSTATNPGDTELTPEQKKAADEAKDPHYPAYYLAQIPMTDQDKTTAHDVIQDGLYNMGLILKDKLEDNGAARTQWERLLTEYPDNVYRLDTYYNLYLMYMRAGDTAEAERWRQLIISEFADSKYGMALQDPDYIKNLREMPARQQAIYDDAYAAYLENRNEEVHGAYEKMMRDYPLSEIMPKFMFLHALAYVTEKKPQEFAATLREMLERYPQTDVTPLASAYLKGVQQGRKLKESTGNVRGMLWDIRLTNDTTTNGIDDAVLEFDLSTDVPQMLVLLFPTDTVSSNQLLYDVARHNFSSFVVKDFDLEQMNFGRLGMLLVKGFANMDELAHYRRVMEADKQLLLPPQVRPVMISVDNFNKLIQHGRSFEEYFRYIDDTVEERTEQAITAPDEEQQPQAPVEPQNPIPDAQLFDPTDQLR